jgi:DNA-directed RNA polymerase subunit RPC12/RpoP
MATDSATERCLECEHRHPGRCQFSPVYDDPSFEDVRAAQAARAVTSCADCNTPVAADEYRCEPCNDKHLVALGFTREQADLGIDVAKRLMGVAS